MHKSLLLLFIIGFSAFSEDSSDERYSRKIMEEYGNKQESIQESEKQDLDSAIQETSGELAAMGGMQLQDTKPEPVKIKESYLTDIMSSASKKFVSEFLAENPFKRVPRAQMKELVLGRLNGLPFGERLQSNPKLLEAFVDFLQDDDALPRILGIVNKPETVKKFSYFAIGIFVIAFILNLFNSQGNLFKRVMVKLSISFGAFVFNLSAFYILFREDIRPTLDIVFKYYHL